MLDFCRIPIEDENELKVIGYPIKFRNEKDDLFKEKPPTLGEHNWQILRNLLKYQETDINYFLNENVVI